MHVSGWAVQASHSQSTNQLLLRKECPNRFSFRMKPSTGTLDSGKEYCVQSLDMLLFLELHLNRSLILCYHEKMLEIAAERV